VTPASEVDLTAIRALLSAEQLPTADLDSSLLSTFTVLRDGHAINGAVGLELFGEVALLRSLVVRPSQRGKGLGLALVQAAEAKARAGGARAIYLLTTTAQQFFSDRGYRAIPRDSTPISIQRTTQFAGLCPSTAIVMVKP
jgi:amino-acid N-acetyltransferase